MDGAHFSSGVSGSDPDPALITDPRISSQHHPDQIADHGVGGLEVSGLERLTHACPLATMLLDFDGTVRLWNHAAERMLGWAAGEVVGRPLPAVAPDEWGKLLDNLASVRRGETLSAARFLLRRRDGVSINVEIWAVALADSDGDQHCLWMAADVTEREKTARYSDLLAAAGEVLAGPLDYEATLQSVARLVVPSLADWCIIDLVSEDETLRRIAVAHVDPRKEEVARELHRRYPPNWDAPSPAGRALREGRSVLFPELPDEVLATTVRDPEHGRLVRELGTLSAIAVPLVARGRTLGVITLSTADSGRRYGRAELATAEDLARRAAIAVDNAGLYAAEQHARDAAEKAVRLRDEFISVASHELKTPITRLKLSTQMPLRLLAREGGLDPDYVRRSLSAIDDQVRKLANLVDQLLDVSRLESGKLSLDRSEVDVVAVVQEVVGAARALDDQHQISYRGPDTLPAFVDPVRLEQVLTNLVDNAVKYSPEGGSIEVEVEVPAPGSARIGVTDHGVGIAPEHRPRVFDRFYQARSGEQQGGMGLGLYVSHEIVRLHGGSIELESPPGGGTRVVVMLPTRPEPAGPRPGGTQAA